MRVYVDTAIHPLRGRLMCHMFSPDLEELHAMADRIGMQRRWYQDPVTMRVSWPHYDIDEYRRSLAVSFGAIECDKYQTVAMAAIMSEPPPGPNGTSRLRTKIPAASYSTTDRTASSK